MFGARTINLHAALVNGMAETLDVDLDGAIADGRLPVEAWRGAVLRCTGCSDPEACKRWQDGHAETGAEEAPDYCRNAALMKSLHG